MSKKKYCKKPCRVHKSLVQKTDQNLVFKEIRRLFFGTNYETGKSNE